MHLAADLGHATAMYNVAKSYLTGANGADRDPYKAAELYRTIIHQSQTKDSEDHGKQVSLGEQLPLHYFLLRKHYQIIFSFVYINNKFQVCSFAALDLAIMLSDGDDIERNEIEAYQLVLAAGDLGNQVALQMRRMMNPSIVASYTITPAKASHL